MPLERILTDHGELLQYWVYFALLAGLGMVEARPSRPHRRLPGRLDDGPGSTRWSF
jgi:hypothetical protein